MSKDTPFWAAVATRLVAFKRIASLIKESPPPFYAPPLEGPDAAKDGLWDWVKHKYPDFESPDFASAKDEDYKLWISDIQNLVLDGGLRGEFYDNVILQMAEASHCWGKKRLIDKLKVARHQGSSSSPPRPPCRISRSRSSRRRWGNRSSGMAAPPRVEALLVMSAGDGTSTSREVRAVGPSDTVWP